MDQSCIDRFYVIDKGLWMHEILKLRYVQTQTLSNHDPIVLTIQLATPPIPIGQWKSTYFKANSSIIKREGMMHALQEAWESQPSLSEDSIRSFALAWKHIRNKYKEIQDLSKQIEDPFDSLYDKCESGFYA